MYLGNPNVQQMLEEMSWDDFELWAQYATVEPFGEHRADLRAGIIAAVVANSNMGKRGRPAKPADFMPKFDTAVKRPLTDAGSWQKAKANAKLMAMTKG